jgi:hypothetical protein
MLVLDFHFYLHFPLYEVQQQMMTWYPNDHPKSADASDDLLLNAGKLLVDFFDLTMIHLRLLHRLHWPYLYHDCQEYPMQLHYLKRFATLSHPGDDERYLGLLVSGTSYRSPFGCGDVQ